MGVAFSESLNSDFEGVSFYRSWTVPTLERAMRRARLVQDALLSEDDTQPAQPNPMYDIVLSRAQWHEVFTDFSHLLLPGQFLAVPIAFVNQFKLRRLPPLPRGQAPGGEPPPRKPHLVRAALPMAAVVLLCDGAIPDRCAMLWQLFRGARPLALPALAEGPSIAAHSPCIGSFSAAAGSRSPSPAGQGSGEDCNRSPAAASDAAAEAEAASGGAPEQAGAGAAAGPVSVLGESWRLGEVLRLLDGAADALTRAGSAGGAAGSAAGSAGRAPMASTRPV